MLEAMEATMPADALSPAADLDGLHFGFRQPPFQGADPQVFFTSSCYVNAYNQLLGAIRQMHGVVALVGESGIGKTLLLNRVIHEAPAHLRFVLCPAAPLAFDDLLTFICEALELTPADTLRDTRIQALRDFLDAARAGGQRLLLVMDDAHGVGEPVLGEVLRLLRRLRAAAPVQLVLAGEAPLLGRVRHEAALHPLAANALELTLEPLSEVEVTTYVRWQLKLAGVDGDGLFPVAAIRRVHRHAGGVPRRINHLCQRALLIAQQRHQPQVTVPMISEAARDQGLPTQATPGPVNPAGASVAPAPSVPRRRAPRWLVGLAILTVVGSASAYWLRAHLPGSGNGVAEEAATAAAPQILPVNTLEPRISRILPPPTEAPPSKPPTAPPPPAKSAVLSWDRSQMAVEYLRRGDRLLELGDVAGARQFYQTAAERGSAAARVAVGKTYDPLVLEARGLRGVYADPAQAAQWYRTALEAGQREAQTRLRALERAALLKPAPAR